MQLFRQAGQLVFLLLFVCLLLSLFSQHVHTSLQKHTLPHGQLSKQFLQFDILAFISCTLSCVTYSYIVFCYSLSGCPHFLHKLQAHISFWYPTLPQLQTFPVESALHLLQNRYPPHRGQLLSLEQRPHLENSL